MGFALLMLGALIAAPCAKQPQRSPDALAAVLRDVHQPFVDCFHATANPGDTGRVVLEFSILPSGEVKDAKSKMNTLSQFGAAESEQCMVAIAQRLRFADVEGCNEPVVVRQSYGFSAAVIPGTIIHCCGMSKEEIQTVVDGAMSDINRCRSKYCGNASLEGKVAIQWTIIERGVTAVSIAENTIPKHCDALMAGCMTDIVRNLKFPPAPGGGIVNVTYPFFFAAPVVELPPMKMVVVTPAVPMRSCRRSGMSKATIVPVISAELSLLQSCY